MDLKTRAKHLLRPLSVLGLALALSNPISSANAAPARQKAKAASVRQVKAPKASSRRAKPPSPAAGPSAAEPTAPATPTAAPAASGAAAKPDGAVLKTEELREGEKTYTFGAQEVEGRLKSPQILYFLRRVRAEFDPAPLGHRSFFLELSDTRRHRAFE